MLNFLILCPVLMAGLIVFFLGKSDFYAKLITLKASIFVFGLCFWLWLTKFNQSSTVVLKESHSWISSLGISFALSLDSFSLLMIFITLLLSIIAILVGWNSLDKWRFFGPLLLMMQAGLIGVFLAEDLMLFYVFWEVMLIPMYFMMVYWGSSKIKPAAIQFLLFTVVASLLMLLAIIALYFIKAHESLGQFSFSFNHLFNTPIKQGSVWILLAFLAGFGVKVPAFPLHMWAPKAYKESHPVVTILLSGAMSNAGIYGILRIVGFISPKMMLNISEVMMGCAAVGVIYTGLIAYRQNDIRSVAAYSSISHMNLALLALFSFQVQALNGAMLQLVAHALSITGIFSIVAMLQKRGYSGDLKQMGGLFKPIPKLGAFFLFFVIASIGLPGLGNFVAEIMMLAGTFQISVIWGSVAAMSIVIGVAYFLKMYESAMLGPINSSHPQPNRLFDLNWREWYTLGLLTLVILWLGIFPQYFIKSVHTTATHIEKISDITWKIN